MPKLTLQSFKSDTLAADLAAGASSATLTTGSFTADTYCYLVLDYDVSAKREVVKCAVSGTAITSMTRGVDGTSDVAHVTGAKVIMAFVPSHYSLLMNTLNDGWIDPLETWTYASASTITVPSGAASRYSIGDKIKLTQTTVKYFVVTAVADTVLTVTGGSDYTVANAAISANYYSKQTSPVGFPQWFAVTAPTWGVTTFDNGAGGQPTTSDYRMSICGRTVTLRAKANGTKAATNNIVTFSALPIASANTTDQSSLGSCYCDVGNVTGSVNDISGTVYLQFAANITDNATIAHLTFTINYEI